MFTNVRVEERMEIICRIRTIFRLWIHSDCKNTSVLAFCAECSIRLNKDSLRKFTVSFNEIDLESFEIPDLKLVAAKGDQFILRLAGHG